jgi:hypothetical protein
MWATFVVKRIHITKTHGGGSRLRETIETIEPYCWYLISTDASGKRYLNIGENSYEIIEEKQG